MFRYIKYLQNKSKHTRKRIALIFAIVLTLIIVVIWFSTLNSRLFLGGGEEAVGSNSSPFSLIKERFQSIQNSVVEKIEQLKTLGSDPQ